MLAYILAIAVALGSLAFYIAAFFYPEIHRKSDFAWSGVGLFYALVLWVCAGRMTGAVLLGQTAGVALLGWFAWQTLVLRRALTPANQRTVPEADGPSDSDRAGLGGQITGLFQRKPKPESASPAPPESAAGSEPEPEATPEMAAQPTDTPAPPEAEPSDTDAEPFGEPEVKEDTTESTAPEADVAEASATEPPAMEEEIAPEPSADEGLSPASEESSETEKSEERSSQKSGPLLSLFTTVVDRVQSWLGGDKDRSDDAQPSASQESAPSEDAIEEDWEEAPSQEMPSQPDAETSESSEEVAVAEPPAEPAEAFEKTPSEPDSATSESSDEVPVEEIAPESEIAPPAEQPGSGDPQDRQEDLEAPVASEAVPIEEEATEEEDDRAEGKDSKGEG